MEGQKDKKMEGRMEGRREDPSSDRQRSNKFNSLADMIKGNINILMISESKLDNSFLDGIYAKVVSTHEKLIESFYVEVNLRKKMAIELLLQLITAVSKFHPNSLSSKYEQCNFAR